MPSSHESPGGTEPGAVSQRLQYGRLEESTAIVIGGESRRVGLALSGGGFRAAAFHLGPMRKLSELGLLDKVDLLTCVSGGSIAVAYMALNWGRSDMLDNLDHYLATRSIAVGSVIGGLDGGKPFSFKSTPTESGAVVLKEGLNIMMEQIRGLQFDRVLHRHRAGVGPRPLLFSIDSKEGEVREGDAPQFASSIDTNLKALNKLERDLLSRHSGGLLESRLKKYAPELLQ